MTPKVERFTVTSGLMIKEYVPFMVKKLDG
jgi:hypothetical protein